MTIRTILNIHLPGRGDLRVKAEGPAGAAPVQAQGVVFQVNAKGASSAYRLEKETPLIRFYFRARGSFWSTGFGKTNAEAVDGERFNVEEPYGQTMFAASYMPRSDALLFIERSVILWALDAKWFDTMPLRVQPKETFRDWSRHVDEVDRAGYIPSS